MSIEMSANVKFIDSDNNNSTKVDYMNSTLVEILYPKMDKWKNKKLSVYEELYPKVVAAFEKADIQLSKEPALINLFTAEEVRIAKRTPRALADLIFSQCEIYTRNKDMKPVVVGRGDYQSIGWTGNEGKNLAIYQSFGEWLSKTLLIQFEKFSAEDLANMVKLGTLYTRTGKFRSVENNPAVVDLNSGNNNYTRINFDAKTVLNSRGIERRANAKVYHAGQRLDSKVALYVMSMMIASRGAKSTNAIINSLPSLWMREDTYGAKMSKNDATRIILDNLSLAVEFKPTLHHNAAKVFPYIDMENAKQDPYDLQQMLESGILAAPDKYNVDWITTDVGAEAMMLGFCSNSEGEKCVVSIHDMSKAGKVYNRPPQAFKYLRADSPLREVSSLRIKLSNGEFAELGGIMKDVAFTNSRGLTLGSGEAPINKGVTFPHVVAKSATRTISTLRLPAELREALSKMPGGLMVNLKKALEMKIQELVDNNTLVKPGEPILSLLDGKYVVINNDSKAQTLRIVGGSVMDDLSVNAMYADTLSIKIDTHLEADDVSVKLRGLGIKLTTIPYRVKGLSQKWDILLNNEAVKGFPALIHLYTIAMGGGVFDPHGAVLTLDNGTVVDFKESTNAFTEWAKENSVKETAKYKMARSVYEKLLATTEIFNGDDMKVIDNGSKTHVIVEETMEVIYGKLPFDIEVSTPREAVGTSTLTLEQMAAIALQNKELSEKIIEEAQPRREAVVDLVEMMGNVNIPHPEAHKINVSVPSGRKELRSIIGNVAEYSLNLESSARVKEIREGLSNAEQLYAQIGMSAEEVAKDPKEAAARIKKLAGFSSDRDIFKVLHEKFPNGLALLASNFTNGPRELALYIKPKAIESLAAFSSNSGTGIALDIVALLCFITDEKNEYISGYADKVFSMITKISYGLETWVSKMVRSAGVLKKMARGGRVVMGKVKTSFHPILNSSDGIPVILINPKCPIGKLLRIKDGELVAINRTPMPFITAARVKFSVIAPECHVVVDPLTWAASNEGDADGDGIGLFNLTPYGINDEQAAEINSSLMGMGGYYFAYGKELPFADFMSYEDKWGKKNFTKISKPIATLIPVDRYGYDAALVAEHYKFNVGISYGVCSTLTFATVNKLYAGDEDLNVYLKACVVAWRLVYEGLGLSGYSEKATNFFEHLFIGVIASSKKDGKVYRSSAQKSEMYLDNCDFLGLDHDKVTQTTIEAAASQMIARLVAEADSDEGSKDEIELLKLEVKEAADYLSKAVAQRSIKGSKDAAPNDEVIDYMTEINSCLPTAVQEDEHVKQIIRRLINCRKVTSSYSRMERGAYVPESDQDWAVIYGCLRRIGQGKDPVEVGTTEDMQYGEVNTSLFVYLTERELANNLKCGFLRRYLNFGGAIYTTLISKIRDENDADE